MKRLYCTKDYNSLSESFFNSLSNGTRTIDESIKELGIFVQGYLKDKKSRLYWVNFKPFDNPKNASESFANAVHFGEINEPEKSIYLQGMKTQQLQFEALQNALIKFISNFNDKERNKVLKKIDIKAVKIELLNF